MANWRFISIFVVADADVINYIWYRHDSQINALGPVKGWN